MTPGEHDKKLIAEGWTIERWEWPDGTVRTIFTPPKPPRLEKLLKEKKSATR